MKPDQNHFPAPPFRGSATDAARAGLQARVLRPGSRAGLAAAVLAAALGIGALGFGGPPALLPGQGAAPGASTTAAGTLTPAGPAVADYTARPVHPPLPLDAFADPAASPGSSSGSVTHAGSRADSGTAVRTPKKRTDTGPAPAKVRAAVVRPPAPAPAPAPDPAPVAAAPAPAPAPAPVPAAPAVRTIYVAGSGGQEMIDACIGPIHFTPNDGYSLFITEHDSCGGWARFSGIAIGETVSLPGYGTYTVTGRGQVPNPGTTNDVLAVFGGFPRAILQTCIPGTSQMLLIALN